MYVGEFSSYKTCGSNETIHKPYGSLELSRLFRCTMLGCSTAAMQIFVMPPATQNIPPNYVPELVSVQAPREVIADSD